MARTFYYLRIWLVATAIIVASSLFLAAPFNDLAPYEVKGMPGPLGVLERARPRPPLTIALPSRATAPEVLLMANYGGVPVVSIAGSTLRPRGYPHPTAVDRYRSLALFDLPANVGNGARGLSIALLRDRLPAGFGSIYVGPRTLIEDRLASLRERSSKINQAMPIAVLLCLMTSIGLIFFSDRPARYAYLIGAFACSIVIELDSTITIFGAPLRAFESYYGTVLIAFSALNLRVWWDRPQTEAKAIFLGAALALVALAAIDFNFGLGSDVTALFRKVEFVGAITALAGYCLALFALRDTLLDSNARTVSAFCSAIVFALLLNLTRHYLPISAHAGFVIASSAKLLGAASIFGLSTSALYFEFHQYALRRRRMGTMQRIISGANLTIDSEARALKEAIEQRTLLEERQRLVRDMHDGIGGQLLSVLLKLRGGEAPRDELAQDVQATIAELRLLTAAMDSEMPGLGGALADLRGRLETQLHAASITLHWSVSPDLDSAAMDNLEVVEVLRFVQEAITNAIRHSGASTVSLSAVGAQGIRISVADNGCGFDPAKVAGGSGLRSLRRRAAKIGGLVDFARPPGGGTSVVLIVPAQS